MTRFAMAALVLAAAVPAATSAQDTLTIVRGTPPINPAPAENFTGTVRLGGAFQARPPARVSGATVAFERGARTHWHSHPLGQTLVVTAGTGRVQIWGAPAREIRLGDVIVIPPGAKHWHGASPEDGMTHVAMVETPANGRATIWMEAVTDAQYAAAPARPPAAGSDTAAQTSRAQQLMGDIAPELARLTDDVLYGQVWANPALSQRDRSLVTISALIALNRPDQLRSHLTIGRSNGLTLDEVVATITHLAFYAGWPNAVTAIPIARQVYGEP
jgi:4-carboxymuconolactone decarboxylase